jgi:hypothetical protein
MLNNFETVRIIVMKLSSYDDSLIVLTRVRIAAMVHE